MMNPYSYTSATTSSSIFFLTITDSRGCTTSCSLLIACTSGTVQGCSQGFWKNHTSIWNAANKTVPTCVAAAIAAQGSPYSGNGTTTSLFRTTFGLTAAQMTAAGLDPNLTLLDALNLQGGGLKALARQA